LNRKNDVMDGFIYFAGPVLTGIIMALDIKKCFKAALLPGVAVFVLSVMLYEAIAFVPVIGPASSLYFVIPLGGAAWAGYWAVKKYGMDLTGGLVTGLFAGVIGALVWGIAIILVTLLLISYTTQGASSILSSGTKAYELAEIQKTGSAEIVTEIMHTAVSAVIAGVEGAIFGAVGAFIASRK
jgi:hypothetical protein